MYKLAVFLFFVLIVGDRIGSLAGDPIPVGTAESTRPTVQDSLETILQDIKERLVSIENRQAAEENQLVAIKESVDSIKSSLAPKTITMKPFKMPDLSPNGPFANGNVDAFSEWSKKLFEDN